MNAFEIFVKTLGMWTFALLHNNLQTALIQPITSQACNELVISYPFMRKMAICTQKKN